MVRWRRHLSTWVLGFFGLPTNHSVLLHSQIFDMVQYGNGFSMIDLYNMPTKLRLFYYNRLLDAKKKENEQVKASQQKSSKVRVNR